MIRELMVGRIGRFFDFYEAKSLIISSYGLEDINHNDIIKFYYKNKNLEICSTNFKVLIKTSKYIVLIDEMYFDDIDKEVYICNIN